MKDEQGPQRIAGDFNAVPWSPVVRRLARIVRLNDPRIGRGWFPTWKAGATLARWPLDHALFTNDFTLADDRVLPPFGANHQPTLTTVCYTPTVVAQNAPEAHADDIATARHAVRTGQNRAVPSPEPAAGKQEPHDSK